MKRISLERMEIMRGKEGWREWEEREDEEN